MKLSSILLLALGLAACGRSPKRTGSVADPLSVPAIQEAMKETGADPASVAEVKELLAKSAGLSVEDSLKHISQHFADKQAKFSWGPLGEGPSGRFDQDPLFRTDTFDCTTFVETVVALATSQSFESFVKNLIRIRFENSNVTYQDRNHFPSVDWIPNNDPLFFSPETQALLDRGMPGQSAPFVTAIIDKKAWYQTKTLQDLNVKGLGEVELQARLKELQSLGDQSPPEKASLPYLSFNQLFVHKVFENEEERIALADKTEREHENLDFTYDELVNRDQLDEERKALEKKRVLEHFKIENAYRLATTVPNAELFAAFPEVSVINIVRENFIAGATPMLVTHQALVVRKSDGKLYVRHAAISKHVLDVPLEEYLSPYLVHSQIRGINVLRLRSQKD